MPGERLTRLTRRLVHDDTFALVVAPAIADLQFEVPSASIAGRGRSYAGVWRALLGAVCLDLARDARILRHDASLLLTLSAMQACYYGGLLVLAMDHLSPQRVAAVVLAILFFSAAFTVLGFWPGDARRVAVSADD